MKAPYATTALVAVLLVASRVAPGLAIINGEPDFNAHPFVGGLVFDLDGGGPIPWAGLCSGSVIAHHAFLTAAHCIAEVSSPALRWGVTLEGGAPGDPVILPLSFEPGQLPFVRVLKPLTVVAATAVEVHPLFGVGHRCSHRPRRYGSRRPLDGVHAGADDLLRAMALQEQTSRTSGTR